MANTAPGDAEPVLEVRDLTVRFTTPEGEVEAVNDVSFAIHSGETMGVVGESGSGKSQLFLAVMGLLAANGSAEGSASLLGDEMIGLPPKALDGLRGGRMAMIFQDPMTSLNPFLRVSTQMCEVLVRHKGMSRSDALTRSVEMLDLVRIPEARDRIRMYPHEFSGGMRQRVMIAMALLCQPSLLIADEPTTALDVTVQAQILELLEDLHKEIEAAIVMITHDLGVVAGLCNHVLVMYAGRVAEYGSIDDIFYRPQHPYTFGLLASSPRLDEQSQGELKTIPGQPPNLQKLPPGCAFAPRCEFVLDRCRSELPPPRDIGTGQRKSCHLERLPAPAASAV